MLPGSAGGSQTKAGMLPPAPFDPVEATLDAAVDDEEDAASPLLDDPVGVPPVPPAPPEVRGVSASGHPAPNDKARSAVQAEVAIRRAMKDLQRPILPWSLVERHEGDREGRKRGHYDQESTCDCIRERTREQRLINDVAKHAISS